MGELCQAGKQLEEFMAGLVPYLKRELSGEEMSAFERNVLAPYQANIARGVVGDDPTIAEELKLYEGLTDRRVGDQETFSCTFSCASCSGRLAILGQDGFLTDVKKPEQCREPHLVLVV